ncbi:MAG TPA: hypothetical protein VIH42_02625 [Thermoguttaceae bacterium]
MAICQETFDPNSGVEFHKHGCLILGSLVCLPLFHGRLADFRDGFVRPEGPLPLGVVERLVLDRRNSAAGTKIMKNKIALSGLCELRGDKFY